MANFKFFNIGKANEEITRLEAELATAQASAKTATENATEVSAQAEKLQSDLKQTNADLATAKTTISSITDGKAKAEADLKAANEKLANPSEQITAAASRKALEITQAQGQSPVVAGQDKGSPGGGDIIAQYAAITDSTAKVEFYRANKAAYDAAFKAKHSEK